MENFDLAQLLSIVFGLLSTVLGGVVVWLKAKVSKVAVAAKEAATVAIEAAEAVKVIDESLVDGLTADEIKKIHKELKDIPPALKKAGEAVKAIFGKE